MWKWIAAAVVALAAVVAVAAVLLYAGTHTSRPLEASRRDATPPPAQRSTGLLNAATRVTPACERAVRDKLPTDTADFPWGNSEDVRAGEGGLYRMESSVKWSSAQGIPMRSRFLCDATADGQVQRVVVMP